MNPAQGIRGQQRFLSDGTCIPVSQRRILAGSLTDTQPLSLNLAGEGFEVVTAASGKKKLRF
ncbi:MAG: hypothetical protein J7603_26535 [Pseudacidovorax sp.]|nr:hypothetical protein [Pseudacidovorax sp.]